MKPKLIKAAVMIVSILVSLLVMYLVLRNVLPEIISIIQDSGHSKELTVEYVRSIPLWKGILVVLILFLVHFVSILIPCVYIMAASGVVYGLAPGMLICLLSITVCTSALYWAIRLIGKKLDDILGGSKGSALFDQYLDKNHPELLLFVAALSPIIPRACLPYFAVKWDVKFRFFPLIMFTGSIPVTFMMCLIGTLLVTSGWQSSLIVTIISVVFSAVVWWQRNRLIKFFLKTYSKLFNKGASE